MMKHKAQEVFIRQRRGFSKENVKVTLYHHTPGLQRDLDEVLLFKGGDFGERGRSLFFLLQICLFYLKPQLPSIYTNKKWTKV